MSLVALVNVLCSDVFVSRFQADARNQATELLLQERVPRRRSSPSRARPKARRRRPSLPVFAARRFSIAPHDDRRIRTSSRTGRYTTRGHEHRRRLQHVA
jgi:cyclic beta-1,2-glucan synthetase